jgi:hypothetical protein
MQPLSCQTLVGHQNLPWRCLNLEEAGCDSLTFVGRARPGMRYKGNAVVYESAVAVNGLAVKLLNCRIGLVTVVDGGRAGGRDFCGYYCVLDRISGHVRFFPCLKNTLAYRWLSCLLQSIPRRRYSGP